MAIKNYSSSMYIGHTSRSIPRPVFFDSHTPIFNNKPPTALVTGSPGSGKTFFCETLAAQSSLLGKKTVVIDPKGDFLALKEIEDEIGKVTLWNLGPHGAKSKPGIIDPFYMSEDTGETIALVQSLIEIFCGGLSENQTTALLPIIQDVNTLATPSMLKLVEICRSSLNEDARNVGTKLQVISKQPSARLCFAPGNVKKQNIAIDKGLTIITLVGLSLPANQEEAKSSPQTRLATGILFLLTDYIRRVMFSDDSGIPKSLIIDEAWSVIASEQGAQVVEAVALLGRSRGVSLTLATQNVSHLKKISIDTTLTSRFAFATSLEEAKDIVNHMGLPQDVGLEGLLTTLQPGECLMQDFLNRHSTVQISAWNDRWTTEFNSNPLEKAKRKKEEAKLREAERRRKEAS